MSETSANPVQTGYHDQTAYPGKTTGTIVPFTRTKEVGKSTRFFGLYYNLVFPFSDNHQKLRPSTLALEKMLNYLSIVFLLASVVFIVPFIEIFSFAEERRNTMAWALFFVTFVPRILIKASAVCMGFVTITTLMLANTGKYFFLSAKEFIF